MVLYCFLWGLYSLDQLRLGRRSTAAPASPKKRFVGSFIEGIEKGLYTVFTDFQQNFVSPPPIADYCLQLFGTYKIIETIFLLGGYYLFRVSVFFVLFQYCFLYFLYFVFWGRCEVVDCFGYFIFTRNDFLRV